MTQAALPLLLALAACGPISMADAERYCLDRAYGATGPHGEVAVGVAGGKPSTRMTLDISTDALMGRDPSTVYNQCVLQKTGQPPSQPLYDRADWKG